MNISLHEIVEIITIMSFAAGIMNYVIVRPLKDAVGVLSKSLDKLEQTLTDVKEKEITLEQRVEFNEKSIKSAHKRIDNLEEYHKQPVK